MTKEFERQHKQLFNFLSKIYPSKKTYSINCKKVSIFYPKAKKYQINNINFTFDKTVAIMGKNGSGKTTLLNALSSLIPYDGSITCKVNGKIIPHKDFCIKYMNLILNGTSLPLNYNLKEFIIENFYEKNIPFNFYRKKALNELVDLLEMKDVINNKFSDMSLGQQQKSSIIFSLLLGKNILMADEIFRGLDSESQYTLQQLFKVLSTKYNVILMITSHLKEDLTQISDNFITMRNNGISSSFSCVDILEDNYVFGMQLPREYKSEELLNILDRENLKDWICITKDLKINELYYLIIDKKRAWHLQSLSKKILTKVFNSSQIDWVRFSESHQKNNNNRNFT